MFYAHDVLTKKGKLGIIWLAATYKGNKSKYLTSKDFKKVNIIKACEYIINPRLPFALRLSSTLMVGLVRVYNEQTRIVLIEANEMMKAVKAAITEQKIAADLKLKQPEQRQESITLPLLLDYEFDLPECQEQIHTDYLVTFAKSNKYFQLPKVKSPELHLPSPITSPGQRISTEEEKSPYQANRKDITIPEIDFNVTAEEEIKIPGEIDIVEPLPYEEIELLEEPGGKTTPKHSLSPLKVTEVPGDESDVMIFDEKTGALKPEGTPTRGTRITHDEGTPQQAGIERQVPDRPVRARRKRKLAVDFTIKLTGLAMRKNLNNADALKKRKICDIPELPSLKDLFTSPATSVVHGPLRNLWESNAKIRPLKDLHWTVPEPTYSSPIIHDELSSGLDESPTSGIELLRAASHLSTDFERSAGMDTTPEVSAILERSRRSRDLSFSGDRKMDVSTGTPSKPYSRLSTADRLSILSPIADRDEDIPELAIPLEDIEEHLSLDEISDQDRISDDATYETIRTIKEVMGDNLMIKLSSAIPYATRRKYAAKLFYNVIALTNIGVLALVQDRPYGEIVIGRGRQY